VLILLADDDLVLVRDTKNPCGSVGKKRKNHVMLATFGKATNDIANKFEVTCGYDHVIAVLCKFDWRWCANLSIDRGFKRTFEPYVLLHKELAYRHFSDILLVRK
jgi:hypothetical protein